MIIPVTSNGKILVDSGVYNSIVSANNDTTLVFNYSGLIVRLIFRVLKEQANNFSATKHPAFNAAVEDGVVVMRQDYRFFDQQSVVTGYTGMLVPIEVGVKPDGKKIYMSWQMDAATSLGGTVMMVTHYSFYEDE